MVRDKATGPAVVPTAWRGPMPDASVRRELATEGGYARVHEQVLLSGLPDLGVMTWVLLRLWADDAWVPATYRKFADYLGMRDLPTKAAEKRFVRVVPAMIEAKLIERRRDPDNQVHYRALMPATGRFAVLRRSYDFPLLASGALHPRTGKLMSVTVSHLVDFARWQLEAGRRGWTTATTAALASRWGVSQRTVEMRRDSLAATGLLRVTRRSGYADLVWLGELHDPHWLVPTEPLAASQAASQQPEQRVAECGNLRSAENGAYPPPQNVGTPYKEHLAEGLEVLTERDLAELGGASATPLTSVTRELRVAEPQAAPSIKDCFSPPHDLLPQTGQPQEQQQRVAGRLLGQHRHLSSAPSHYVKAMVKLLTRELDRGLHPGHVARALERCIADGEVDAHCELVRLAVRQAWGDQRAGACAECGDDVGEHRMGCADRAAEVDASIDEAAMAEINAAVLASLTAARASGPLPEVGRQVQAGPAQPADPLAGYLSEPLEPDWSAADEDEVASWLTARLAAAVADAADRPAALLTVWRSWRSQVAPQHLDLVDAAAAHLRLVLQERRAS